MKNQKDQTTVGVEVSENSLELLKWLARKGVYGATPEIVAARLVDQGLQGFVEVRKVPWDQFTPVGPPKLTLDEDDALLCHEALKAAGDSDELTELVERIECFLPKEE